jgi:hypothetical protein
MIWYAITWLLLGIASDLFCEAQARKLKEPYRRSTQVVCYLVGPVMVPLALLSAIIKSIVGK